MTFDFDKLIVEDKNVLDIAITELQNAKAKHEPGLLCWCYEGDVWVQRIAIDGYMIGMVWSKTGSIFCWLCTIDEIKHSCAFHQLTEPIYSNEEFHKHVMHHHLICNDGWSKYLPLPETSRVECRSKMGIRERVAVARLFD